MSMRIATRAEQEGEAVNTDGPDPVLELEGYYMIPEAFGKRQVGHLCDTRECVRVSHLKIWISQDDANDKVSKGRQARVRGERIGSAKLDQAKVEEIRSLFAAGDITGMALSRRFRVSRRNIGRILRGEIWRHIV